MESHLRKRKITRKRRKLRVSKSLFGTKDRPRLSIFKSNVHLSAQLINDEERKTIASVSTLSKENQTELAKKSKAAAEKLGKQIAEKAKELNLEGIIFDRGRYKYHGLLAILANSAREAGLQF